jgi:hypothetical protein
MANSSPLIEMAQNFDPKKKVDRLVIEYLEAQRARV